MLMTIYKTKCQFEKTRNLPPEKTTLKKPTLIMVKKWPLRFLKYKLVRLELSSNLVQGVIFSLAKTYLNFPLNLTKSKFL